MQWVMDLLFVGLCQFTFKLLIPTVQRQQLVSRYNRECNKCSTMSLYPTLPYPYFSILSMLFLPSPFLSFPFLSFPFISFSLPFLFLPSLLFPFLPLLSFPFLSFLPSLSSPFLSFSSLPLLSLLPKLFAWLDPNPNNYSNNFSFARNGCTLPIILRSMILRMILK